MKKQISYFLLIICLIILVSACNSSNDNPTEPATSNSVITGNWKSGTWASTGGSVTDSLVVKLSLNEKNGVVGGTGTVGTVFQDNGNAISVTMNGEVTGTYSGQNINLSLTSSITGDKYIYSGSWQTVNTNFIGSASITALGKPHVFTEISLYIKK